MQTVNADFNTLNQDFPGQDPNHRRVVLGRTGSLSQPLTPNETVVLSDGDIEVTATIIYESQVDAWLAVPDWATRRDLPAA